MKKNHGSKLKAEELEPEYRFDYAEAKPNRFASRGKSVESTRSAMKLRTIGKHLVVDPRVCHGQLTFLGTRVPVETVLQVLSEGRSIKRVLQGWPELTREAIVEAIQLAADALVRQARARAGSADEPARSGRST